MVVSQFTILNKLFRASTEAEQVELFMEMCFSCSQKIFDEVKISS